MLTDDNDHVYQGHIDHLGVLGIDRLRPIMPGLSVSTLSDNDDGYGCDGSLFSSTLGPMQRYTAPDQKLAKEKWRNI